VLCLAAGAYLGETTHQKVGIGWLLAFHFLNDIGFANVLPVGLAFYTRSAPRALTGFIVGVYYLHLWAGNTLVGWLAGKLDSMAASQFWLLHAALVGAAGAIFLVVRLVFGHLILGEPADDFTPANVVAADAGETP
jgi:POT family proton-dependent oligopeptide transporter